MPHPLFLQGLMLLLLLTTRTDHSGSQSDTRCMGISQKCAPGRRGLHLSSPEIKTSDPGLLSPKPGNLTPAGKQRASDAEAPYIATTSLPPPRLCVLTLALRAKR